MSDGTDGGELDAEVLRITPVMAAQWLEMSERRGALGEDKVARFSQDMQRGKWKLNGEAILFDVDGHLIDGRRRLAACVQCETPFKSLVIRNVSLSAARTLDTRRTRQIADVLSITGRKHGRALGTTLKLVANLASGTWLPANLTQQGLLDLLLSNPGIEASLDLAMQYGRDRMMPPAMFAAAHFLLSRVSPAEAAEFMVGITRHEELLIGDARKALAKKLYEIDGGRSMTHELMFGLIFKAWNNFRNGEPIHRIVEPRKAFPEISGWHPGHAIDLSRLQTGDPEIDLLEEDDAQPSLQVRFGWVGPDEAKQLLALNRGNRAISPKVVAKYARNMRSSDWALNGETIKISVTDRLLDGQHRLSAIVLANAIVPLLIVSGVPDDVFDTLDIGQRRDYQHVLADRGVKYALAVAGAVNFVWRVENNLVLTAEHPTVSELDATLEAHPHIKECTTHISAMKPWLPPSVVVACHYLFERAVPERVEEFFEKLRGVGSFTKADPLLNLRNKLGERKSVSGVGGSSPTTRLMYTVIAWNAFVENRPFRKADWERPEGEPAFPAIIGSHDISAAA